MKYLLFSLLLSLLYINGNTQTPITGTVRDKNTNNPVPDVIVQYGTTSKDYNYTNKEGVFSIPAGSNDMIHFQCFGYKSRSIPKSAIIQHPQVIMELNPVSLSPVVISPYDADILLEEAMLNTKKNLVTNYNIGYLLHFLQTRNSDSIKNEIYLKYTTNLNPKSLKKQLKEPRIPYIYNIVDIKRIKKSITPTSDLYGAEYHASHLFSFEKSINNQTTRSYTSDSSLIILNIEPLPDMKGWARGEVRINKKDMTLASMEIESVDSILESQPRKKYMGKSVKTLRKVGRFEFAQAENQKYYMKECYTYYKFSIIDDFGNKEEIAYHCDVNCIGTINPKQIKNRRLSGYCQELFYFPDSTEEPFWLSTEGSENISDKKITGDLSLGNNSTKKKTFSNYLKGSLGIIPIAILLLVI